MPKCDSISSGETAPPVSPLGYGALAQLARAPALQAGGQEFESLMLHHSGIVLKFRRFGDFLLIVMIFILRGMMYVMRDSENLAIALFFCIVPYLIFSLIGVLIFWLDHFISSRKANTNKKNSQINKYRSTTDYPTSRANKETDMSGGRNSKLSSNNVELDKEIKHVMKIIGVAEPADSMSIIDDVLNGNIKNAALLIAQKLSIMNQRLLIKEQPTIEYDKHGNEIVAKVSVSDSSETIFGTDAFNYQTINITTFKNYNAYPDKFIYVIAHELCHKVLHSLDHNRPSGDIGERETDMAVVLSGFGNSYIASKNIDNGLGYLNMLEAGYVKREVERILEEVKKERAAAYADYVHLRQLYEDKIIFLDVLYKAKRLRGNNEWELDYSTLGDDYNKLLICTKTILVEDLKMYIKICDYFKRMKKQPDRYSSDILCSKQKIKKLEEILSNLELPKFEYRDLLKKYS